MSEQFPVLGYILENIKVGSIKQSKKPPMTLSHGNDRQKKMNKHFLIMTLSIISLLTNGNRAEALVLKMLQWNSLFVIGGGRRDIRWAWLCCSLGQICLWCSEDLRGSDWPIMFTAVKVKADEFPWQPSNSADTSTMYNTMCPGPRLGTGAVSSCINVSCYEPLTSPIYVCRNGFVITFLTAQGYYNLSSTTPHTRPRTLHSFVSVLPSAPQRFLVFVIIISHWPVKF